MSGQRVDLFAGDRDDEKRRKTPILKVRGKKRANPQNPASGKGQGGHAPASAPNPDMPL